MRVTAYTYPWDVACLGVDRVLEDLAAQGIAGMDLAATYHPIDALSPRGGFPRHFTNARGAVHFPARISRYGRIRPAVSSPEICAVWPQIAQRAPSFEVDLNAWTVVLYQPWIVDQYPDCARVLPSGDPIGSGVCAANEDVREYLARLCEDLVDQFGVPMIRLEGLAPSGYDYGWLRPRVQIDVPAVASDLLALCFCRACVTRGIAAGLDVERLRVLVCDRISREIGSDSARAPAPGAPDLLGDPELHEFVVQHDRASIELASAATSRLSGRVPRISTTGWMTYAQLLGAPRVELFGALAESVDQLMIGPRDAECVAELNKQGPSRGSSVGRSSFLSPLRLSPAGIPVLPGLAQERREGAAEFLRAIAPLDVEEVCVYNYGLLPDSDLRDLVEAVRAALP